jgi:metal-responsive CopG/Arc/MetJ family transcriptional regulator
MSSQTFNLSLPQKLVAQMDDQAKRDFSTRSDFVRKAIVNQLRAEQSVSAIFDRANQRGKDLGITSEQQVYDIIDSAD